MTLSNGFAPFYSERPIAALVELNQLYLGYTAVAILIGLLLVLPGVRGKSRIFFLFRWTTSLFIGASIIACAQGVSWHVAKVDAMMPYRVHTNLMERFEIGLKIGLTTFNVTLRGQNALMLSEEFRFLESDAELERGLKFGLPFPILNVLEHFSVDRVSSMWLWGRRYWLAGHYASYLLWSAFATWIFTNLLFHAVLRYGGLVLSFTGILLLGANLSFYSVGHVGCHLTIQLGYYDSAVLRPEYGWCFWLCLFIGVTSVVLGLSIFMADHLCSKSLARFFNKKKKNEEEELYEIDSDNFSLNSRRSSSVQLDKGCFNCGFQYNNNIDEVDSGAKHPYRFSEQLPRRKYSQDAQTSQALKQNTATGRQALDSPTHSSIEDPAKKEVLFSHQFLPSNQPTKSLTSSSGLSPIEDVQM